MSRGAIAPATIARPRAQPQAGAMPSIVRIGVTRFGFGDVYHAILMMRWSAFLGLIVLTQIGANLGFAVLYALQPNAVANAHGLLQLFYFSVQTWATIGYGGMMPTSTYANLVMVAESISGIMFTAVTTGLVFAKFARPSARVLFANKMVVTTRDGKRYLMIRVANERGNNVVEASARVTVLRDERSQEGEQMRRLYDLDLVRNVQPLFIISWTLMHEITPSSLLWGKTGEDIEREDWRFTVSLTGHDGTVAQTIHASHLYAARDVAFDSRYVDVVETLPDGRIQIDLGRFHEVEAQAPAL